MNRTYWLVWLLMPVIGIANGALRVLTYANLLGDASAHQLSCLTGIVFFGAYIWFVGRRRPFASSAQALLVGLSWMALTVAFEFTFGLLLGGTLAGLVADYNILAGRLWPLVLLTIGFAPYLFYRLTQRAQAPVHNPA